MSGERVLRVYHSAVVGEYRERDHLLRARHGYDLHVACPPAWHEGGSLVRATDDADVPLHIVPVRGRQHPILFWYATGALRRLLRELRPDIVDLHEEPYSLAVAAALRVVRAEAPEARVCMYTAQNILKRYPPPFRQLERRAMRSAAAMYPCSTEAGEVMAAKGFAGAVNVLPLGVALRSGPRTEFAVHGLRVGFLGRLETYKGGEVAVRAFAAATEGTDAVLEVVGAGSQRDALEACAKQLGIVSRVVFAGPVSHEEALVRIRGYDVVLVPSISTPSWKEQFGRIPAQALEAGTPVIASDSGSLREVLGDCGELAEEGSVEDFAQRLARLLRDPARRADLSVRGQQRAVAQFSWETVSDGFDRMYREMLARK